MFGSAVPGMPLNPMDPLTSSVMNSDIVTVEDVVRGISTGYVLLDATLCLLVPLVVQLLISALFRSSSEGRKKLWTLLRLSSDDDEAFVIRTIEITQRFNNYGNKIWDYEQKNHLLQKAVSIYLSKALDLENKDTKYVLFEKTAADLSDDEKDDASVAATNTTSSSNNSDDEYEDDEDDFETSVDKLYVKAMPLCNVWVEIEKGVDFMHEVEENNGEKKGPRETKVTFKFRSKLPDASDRIDALIDRAYSSYRESERRKHITDKTRYFYIQSGTKDGSGGGDEGDKSRIVAYKRYALGEEKTFDNLFFQEKKQVLQLLDNFTNKSGKFAIKGFPYKLGLLLHGPPGTGKTSLIKAIAQHTKRHIVTISLAKIKTNQELLDALFDMKFAVHGHDTPFELTFNDVVFVMEDIDCASSIVNSRGADDDDNDKVKSRSSKMIESQKKATKDDDGMEGMIGPLLPKPKNKDKLNLSGLLNVLDGVIDCPGRILIMTTNHPEKLDPALIRPGRVNKKLFLSHMEVPQAREMIEYYCSTSLTEEETHQLERIFEAEDFQATPAELEELCAEFDDAATILKELSAKTTTQN